MTSRIPTAHDFASLAAARSRARAITQHTQNDDCY